MAWNVAVFVYLVGFGVVLWIVAKKRWDEAVKEAYYGRDCDVPELIVFLFYFCLFWLIGSAIYAALWPLTLPYIKLFHPWKKD